MHKGQNTRQQTDRVLESLERLDATLHRARDDAAQASQLETLGLLTGAIAHEFNNILTPVLSYARVALDSPEDRALCLRALERAAAGAERASRIATSVLRLAGRTPDEAHAACQPREALRAAVGCLGEPLDALSVELRDKLPDGLTLAIPQTDLEHVFLNLVLNAVRALGGTGGVIEVGLVGSDSTWNVGGGGVAVMAVEDTGPGIDAELLPRLFEPFPSPGGPGGNGLGLAICRRLVEAAGGRIAADTAGRGARFLITLPVAPA